MTQRRWMRQRRKIKQLTEADVLAAMIKLGDAAPAPGTLVVYEADDGTSRAFVIGMKRHDL